MWGPPGQKMNDRPPKSQSPLAANAAIERRKAVKTQARQGTKATHWHSGRPTATTNRQAAKVNVGIRALITFITHRGSWTQPDFAQVWARSASWRGPREIARGGFLTAPLAPYHPTARPSERPRL